MIEILIKYIQDKGFEVDVLPGFLAIRKKAKGLTFENTWVISKLDLRYGFEEVLYHEATKRCEEIDEAIEEQV